MLCTQPLLFMPLLLAHLANQAHGLVLGTTLLDVGSVQQIHFCQSLRVLQLTKILLNRQYMSLNPPAK
jgi:hypothetical protein